MRRRTLDPPMAALAGLCALAAVTLGGCAGSLLGGADPSLYRALAETDLALAEAAVQQGLETRPNGMTETWHNPATGQAGAITPRVTMVSDSGHFCRRYDEALALADGRRTTLVDTACRDATGKWIRIDRESL